MPKPNPEMQFDPEAGSALKRYNIAKLREVYGEGPHDIVGHDVGIHWGGSGWDQMMADHTLVAGRKIWRSDQGDPLRQEYDKHFTKADDGKFKYLYNLELQASVCKLSEQELYRLRDLIQSIIYSELRADIYKRLKTGVDLDECHERLKVFFQDVESPVVKPLRVFLQQEIDQLKKMDPVEDDYKEIFVLLTVISMHAYDELVRRNRVT